jgi:glycosyltransferase involved in cell wall biosynthesis
MDAVSVSRPLPGFSDTGTLKLLFSGRITEGKGHIDLVRAFEILVKRDGLRNIHASILGAEESSYLDYLKREVHSSGLSDFFEFIPFTNKVIDYISTADVGVNASRNEAFGRVTVEYLKQGLLTIGADSGGTAEILSNFKGESYLYQPGDAEGLASVIRTILATPLSELQNRVVRQKILSERMFNQDKHYRQFKAALP